jgi:peptidoglycan/LPS O-acetylase OafA/YrhL
MVLVAHAQKNVPSLLGRWVTIGFSGVDLFFVLSGFLITGILLDSKAKLDYFKRFYLRRAFRIWPLFYLVIAAMLFCLPLVSKVNIGPPRLAYLLYIQNFFPALEQASGPLFITWSLAVEEQFYFLWPPLVKVFDRQRIAMLAAAIYLASPLLRFLLESHVHTYSFTFTHLDGLACGAFLACVDLNEIPSGILWTILGVGFGGYAWLHATNQNIFQHSLVSLAFSAALLLARNSSIRVKFFEYTGKVSYCLYLTHVLVFDSLRTILHNQWLFLPAALGCSYGVASLSWRFFESPVLGLRESISSPQRKSAHV